MKLLEAVLSEEECDSSMRSAEKGVEEEVVKKLVVVDADTVAHPGTVVVHFHNALVAYRAVMCARRLYLLALLAVPESYETSLLLRKSVVYFKFYFFPLLVSLSICC